MINFALPRPVALCLLLTLAACEPLRYENNAIFAAQDASRHMERNWDSAALSSLEKAMQYRNGPETLAAEFAATPKLRDLYFDHLQTSIAAFDSPSEPERLYKLISQLKAAGAFSEANSNYLLNALNSKVEHANLTGSIPFVLGDPLESFPAIQTDVHQDILFQRTISNLQAEIGRRSAPALIDYLQQKGRDTRKVKIVEAALPSMNLRSGELASVATLFPQFAALRKEQITARVSFQMKNGDRLLQDDLLQAFGKKIKGVVWDTPPGKKTMTVIVERIRDNEARFREVSETVTYSAKELDREIPPHFTYAYEAVTGGSQIEYGYAVYGVLDGKTVFDEVVRGTLKDEYVRCENRRIENPRGGSKSVDFTANSQMESRCSNSDPVPMEDMRRQVYAKIADKVLKIPVINTVQQYN